jgi:hypothetical protein
MGNQKRMTLKELRERMHSFRGKREFEDDNESCAGWKADLNRKGKDHDGYKSDA